MGKSKEPSFNFEKEAIDVLEPELMDVLDLLQGRIADFDENYHIRNLPIIVACGNNPCSGACGRSCSDDCEYSCGGGCSSHTG